MEIRTRPGPAPVLVVNHLPDQIQKGLPGRPFVVGHPQDPITGLTVRELPDGLLDGLLDVPQALRLGVLPAELPAARRV